MATSPDIVEIINTSLENLKQSTKSITDFSSANTQTVGAINVGIAAVKEKLDGLKVGITKILAAKKNIEEEIGKIKEFPEGFKMLNAAITGLEKVIDDSINLDDLNEAVGNLENIVNPEAGIGPAPPPGAGAGAGAPGAPPPGAGAGRGGGKRNTKGGYIINSHKKKSYSRRSRRSSRPKRGRLSKTRKSTKSKK
tara:strand:+ start:722 stop:1306 length:585 start_codon:yes stop_codon:yes gene_type:complete